MQTVIQQDLSDRKREVAGRKKAEPAARGRGRGGEGAAGGKGKAQAEEVKRRVRQAVEEEVAVEDVSVKNR